MAPPKLGRDRNGYPMQFARFNTTNDATKTGVGAFNLDAETSSAFANVTYVEITAFADVWIDIGASATAVTSQGKPMLFGQSVSTVINEGEKISVIGGLISIVPYEG